MTDHKGTPPQPYLEQWDNQIVALQRQVADLRRENEQLKNQVADLPGPAATPEVVPSREILELVSDLRARRIMCNGGNGNVYDIADDVCEKAADFIEAMTFDIRCNTCGRFMMPKPGDGWEAHGEFGEIEEYVCAGCLSRGTKLQAGNGTTDPRWCGIIVSRPHYCTPDGPANCEAWAVDKRCPDCPVSR